MLIHSLEKPHLPPFRMPDRFRTQIAYFMTPSGEHGAPKLGPQEYWIRLDESREWLDNGVLYVVSPLDAESKAEVELSEEQEAWLEWMVENELQHIRVSLS